MMSRKSSGRLASGLWLLAMVVFVLVTFAMGMVFGRTSQPKVEIRSPQDFWSRIVSPDTVKVVRSDELLQHNYLGAVELAAGLTQHLAERFDMVPELKEASANLEQYRRDLAASTKPLARRDDPLTAIGQLLGFPTSSDSSVNMTSAMDGILSTITAPITNAISGLGDSLLSSAGGAAMFLGTGLGAGAAQGLNLAPAAMTTQVAAKVVADNGMNATGLNPMIQSAAMGAAASLLGSVNTSSLAGGLGSGPIDLNGIALGLAMGIGNGTSAGLNLSPQAAAQEPPTGNSTAEIAGTFGFGLTKSLTSNIDMSKLSTGSSFNISQLTGGTPLSQIAVSLASGLGNGAVSGLKLTQASLAPPTGDTASDAIGAFGFGLTDSVTNNLNTTSLLSGLKNTNANGAFSNINLAQTASSFATGLGTGAAAGLKLSNNVVGAPDVNDQTIPSVAGNFAFGLTKSVTENLNTSQLASGGSSGLSSLTSSLDIGRVAQGAAMGLLQGAGDAVNSMGGLQALINGTAVMSAQPLPVVNMSFNDSVGGAATGFGQGLGGQGTLVGIQLLSQVNVTSLVDGLVNGTTPGVTNSTASVKRDHFLPVGNIRRQVQGETINNNNSFNLSALINADTISSIGQRAIDALSCEGIGGLILVGLGLVDSGTISLSSGGGNSANASLITQVLPKGVMKFNSSGNTYTIDGTIVADNINSNLLAAAGGITVNSNPLVSFVAFLVLHVLLAVLDFLILVPLALGLDASRNLLVRLKLSHVLIKFPKWVHMIWTFVMPPLTILTIIFGALAGGSSGHFRTAHGVLGFFAVLIALAGSGIHYWTRMTSPAELRDGVVFPMRTFRLQSPLTIRTVVNQVLLALVLPVVITGFADLSSISICITRVFSLETSIGFATGLTFLFTLASAISGLTLMLAIRDIRMARKSGEGVDGELGGGFLKEKITMVRPQSTEGKAVLDGSFERN